MYAIGYTIIPNYANMKVPVTSPASRLTQNKIHKIRLKDEIKFLYSPSVTYWIRYITVLMLLCTDGI
jgi:hypothetical protein